jgi:hypothetical protein
VVFVRRVPQPDTRTPGHSDLRRRAVSYDLSGEPLTERGLSGRPHPAPGPRTRRASAGQRYIRWFFRQYYQDPELTGLAISGQFQARRLIWMPAIRARVSRSCTTMARYRVEMIPRLRQRARVRWTVSRQEPIQEASSAIQECQCPVPESGTGYLG